MQYTLTMLKSRFRDFNERAFDFDDFELIARRERINWMEAPLPDAIRGFYSCVRRRVRSRRWIVFNDNLGETERTFTAFHELAHHFLHAPQMGAARLYCPAHRDHNHACDVEADAAALLWMIPARDLYLYSIAASDDIEPSLVPFLIRRKMIWEKLNF